MQQKKDYEAFKTELGDFLIVRSGTVGTYGIVDVVFLLFLVHI